MKFAARIEVDALRWDGSNTQDVIELITGERPENPFALTGGSWIKQKVLDPNTHPVLCVWFLVLPDGQEAEIGDWIVRSARGGCLVRKPENFANEYIPC